MRAVAQYATFTLTAPYAAVRGAAQKPLGDLALHHHQHPVRSRARRRAGRTPAGVATLYGRLATSTHRSWPPSSAAQSRLIASASTTVTSVSATTSRSTGTTPRSISTAVHRGAGLGQREGERAEAGADLDDAIARADVGQAGDAPDGVGVGDEVLTEAATRGQPVVGEQLVDVGA